MASPALEFSGISGQTLIKEPGSINGESFTLTNLDSCKVFILDYTSLVEVSNVTNSQIFIGPVDGAAIFDNVTQSRVAVAAQQFQAKNVTDTEFGLYSATQPTFNNCANVQIGPWNGEYPGLAQHFQAANLDPKSNNWNQAKDISPEESFEPTFTLVNSIEAWDIPPDASSGLENPGQGFSPDGNTNGFGFDNPAPVSNGFLDPADFSEASGEHPKMKEINDKLRERQESQETREKQVKTELIQKASAYLEDFYSNRRKKIDNKAKINRESEQALPAGGVEGNTEWEKAVNLVDFNFTRPSGTDLSRFKNVLFSAKSKNVPLNTKFGA